MKEKGDENVGKNENYLNENPFFLISFLLLL